MANENLDFILYYTIYNKITGEFIDNDDKFNSLVVDRLQAYEVLDNILHPFHYALELDGIEADPYGYKYNHCRMKLKGNDPRFFSRMNTSLIVSTHAINQDIDVTFTYLELLLEGMYVKQPECE